MQQKQNSVPILKDEYISYIPGVTHSNTQFRANGSQKLFSRDFKFLKIIENLNVDEFYLYLPYQIIKWRIFRVFILFNIAFL